MATAIKHKKRSSRKNQFTPVYTNYFRKNWEKNRYNSFIDALSEALKGKNEDDVESDV